MNDSTDEQSADFSSHDEQPASLTDSLFEPAMDVLTPIYNHLLTERDLLIREQQLALAKQQTPAPTAIPIDPIVNTSTE